MSDDWDDDLSAPGTTGTGGASDPLVQAEYERMEQRYTDAGYREGITDGKLQMLQQGFDASFSQSVPSSRRLGNLRGRTNALLAIATTSQSPPALVAEIRELVADLSSVKRNDVLPPDTERIAHEEEHGEVDEIIAPTDSREMEGLEDALGGLGKPKPVLREEELLTALEARVAAVEAKVLHV